MTNADKFIVGNSEYKPGYRILSPQEIIEKYSKLEQKGSPNVRKQKTIETKVEENQEENKVQENKIILPNENLSFITDENLFNEINKYLKSNFPKLENEFIFEDNVMKQSNPYLAVAVDMFCKKNLPNYRIVTQADLETNLDFFKGHYIDSGLALKNLKDAANLKQAKYLFEQFKQRECGLENLPIFINLRGLNLDSNLNFNLTDESLYKLNANCLNWNNGASFSQTDDFGLPKEIDKNSTRKIWTSDNCLGGFYLNGGSDVDSGYRGDLVDSGDDGRVVLAKV